MRKVEKYYDCYLQESNYDCGVASLLTIFNNLGLKISREKIVNLLNIDQGISAYDLIKVSKHFGIDAKGVRGNINLLKKEDLPCICHSIKDKSLYHYIVILEKNNNSIKIMDPASGIEEISINYLNEISTGIFILFDKLKVKINKDKRFKKIVLKVFKENKKLISVSVMFSLLFILSTLIFNYYVKLVLSFFNKPTKTVLLLFITFFILCIIKNIVKYLKNIIILKVNNNIDLSITSEVINHILNLPYSYFIKKTTGELTSITSDIENFKDIIIKIFIICTVDLLLFVVITLYITYFNFIYTLVFIGLSALILCITIKFQYVFNNKYLKVKSSKISFSSKLIDNFISYDTIKNLHIEDKKINNIMNEYHKVIDANKKYTKKYYNYDFLVDTLNEVFYLILIALSVISFFKINPLDLVLLSSLFIIILNLLKDICDNISMYKMYQTSVIKVLDILEIKKEAFVPSRLSTINKIEFKDLKCVFNEDLIFKNITFSINKHENVIIKGPSGVGKSTLIKILLRYNDYSKGEVLIDKLSIKDLSLEFIRNNITYISQNETLFIDSIYNNLALVEDDEEKIKLAMQTVLFDKRINIKTFVLEENGLNISGGERKKIVLARALLKAKNILILDETFNEISENEEALIIENIKKNYPYLTIVLITHRSTNKSLFEKEIEITKGGAYERITKERIKSN